MTKQQWLTTPAGTRIPPIIYGTAWKKERTADLVEQAISKGFQGIDTACQPKHYNEQLVGEALVRLSQRGIARETLFVQTKYTPLPGHDPHTIPYDQHADFDRQVVQSFASSITNLQTTYIDSFLLHSPVTPFTNLMTVWRAMETIHRSGGALELGISNCYELDLLKALYAEAEVKPSIIQNRFYRETGYDLDLRRWCTDHGVIYQSFWTLTANTHVLTNGVMQTMAYKYGKTVCQVFFRYLHQCGIVPLTGTTSEQHMEEDLCIFDFQLSGEEVDLISFLLN